MKNTIIVACSTLRKPSVAACTCNFSRRRSGDSPPGTPVQNPKPSAPATRSASTPSPNTKKPLFAILAVTTYAKTTTSLRKPGSENPPRYWGYVGRRRDPQPPCRRIPPLPEKSR
ncbi:hypothetical protein U1Q18_016190 [Sarracenia purpurea var. burkii]